MTKIFLSCGIWNMEDQFFVKSSRVIVFKTYYVSFDLMMLQLDDLAGHQTNFHLLEMHLKFGMNLLDAFVPGPNLTVDEQLMTFHGRCPFCQYMPSRPGKYGIKIWAICDSTTHYVLKMDVHKGRKIGEPRKTNLGSKLVLKLSEPFKKSGRNITCDNFFTNLEWGRKLIMQNLTIVGTIRKSRRSFL